MFLAPTPDMFRTTGFQRPMHKLPRRLANHGSQAQSQTRDTRFRLCTLQRFQLAKGTLQRFRRSRQPLCATHFAALFGDKRNQLARQADPAAARGQGREFLGEDKTRSLPNDLPDAPTAPLP